MTKSSSNRAASAPPRPCGFTALLVRPHSHHPAANSTPDVGECPSHGTSPSSSLARSRQLSSPAQQPGPTRTPAPVSRTSVPPGQGNDVTTGHLDDRLHLDHSPIVVTNATDHFGR